MANINKNPKPDVPETVTKTEENDFGTIQISEEVIDAVVRKYTLSVPGVARLVGQSIVGGLAGIIGKKMTDRAIRVEIDDHHVNVTVNIIIKFGEHVPTVASNVQHVCRKYIQELTGQSVGKVNVVIQGLEPEHEQEDDELALIEEDDEQDDK